MRESLFTKVRALVVIDDEDSKKKRKKGVKVVPLVEPLDRTLAERVYSLDKELDEVVKHVQEMRERVPIEAMDRLNKQMDNLAPSLP